LLADALEQLRSQLPASQAVDPRPVTPLKRTGADAYAATQILPRPCRGRAMVRTRHNAVISPISMNFEYFSLTDTGMVRENNEDSVLLDTENHVVILADGMGGYNAGEVASAMATTFVRTELGRWLAEGGHEASPREFKRRAMEICIDNANRSIFNAANAEAQYAGMGTTLVMGVFQKTRA
jgi:hypothetical protein